MKIVFTFLLLLGATDLFANDYETSNSFDTSLQQVWLGDNFVQDRLDKKIQFTVEPLGVDYIARTQAKGATLGYFFNLKYFLYVQIKNYDEFKRYYSISTDTEKIKTRGFGLRTFVKNSLFIDFGLNQRTASFREETFGLGPEYNSAAEFEYDVIVSKLSIGNQWQWRNASFGLDWLSLSVPVNSRLRNQAITGYQFQYNTTEFQDRKNKLANNNTWSAFNFSLGLAF